MLRLLLFRHAKSSWSEPDLPDRERPLAPRGRRTAPQMGAMLAEQGLLPDLVLCSPARRARETLDLAMPSWSPRPAVRFIPTLHGASADNYLEVVRDEGGGARRLMLVGHNPAMQEMALLLIAGGDSGLLKRLTAKFPTAAVAVIDLDAKAWSDVAPGTGQLLEFLVPR